MRVNRPYTLKKPSLTDIKPPVTTNFCPFLVEFCSSAHAYIAEVQGTGHFEPIQYSYLPTQPS